MNELSCNIDNECPICFEYIDIESGLIIMDCCKKKVHIHCLVNWYRNNSTKTCCFICNQSNTFCKDLTSYGQELGIEPHSTNQNTINTINTTNNNQVNIENVLVTRCKQYVKLYIFVFIVLIGIIILVVLVS